VNLQQLPPWNIVLSQTAWLVGLALLPWWLGLSLLLALVVLLLSGLQLAGGYAASMRNGLRWGLPGVLFALQRALGGDALAWGVALLGMLVGYMLIVGLELWLDRDIPHMLDPAADSARDATSTGDAEMEWPARVMSSAMGPPAEIITLEAPQWQASTADIPDPWGHQVRYRDAGYRFAGDRRIEDADACACFSPDGRWFAARMQHARGVLLWDRRRDRVHRLRGWQLAGWYREQPWLQRDANATPRTLQHVLGEDEAQVDAAE
jgi:hypothetical protein